MPLILKQADPIHWAAGGAIIAAVTLLLLFVLNRRLGISTGFEDVCSLVVRTRYFERASLWMLAGNQRALRFYRREGWVADGRSKLVTGPGGVALEHRGMARPLARAQ